MGTKHRCMNDLSTYPCVIHKSIEVDKSRCKIELGNNRFVQATEWYDEIRIDIREWELKDEKLIPTKKGNSLPLHRWKLMVDTGYHPTTQKSSPPRRVFAYDPQNTLS
ncbi:Hypothetical predicted protein [Mytilus galloprovincialis]|uniref:Transcriptional coactivator p15 (PC4) C-terminal domain-containing protein n=1 Tax=Mytilus galloprovincialis TaxID=29158 RepID=A0A8B6FMG2_MYTGA|nr:Hypothetical predicted protein [Mytilus galloprovincialis]